MTTSTIGRRQRASLGAGALVALALAGCTSAPETEAERDAAPSSAARFIACLETAGVDAQLSDEGYVLVKVASQTPADGTTFSADSSGGGEGALLHQGDSDGDSWVAVQSSTYFVDDPDLEDAYAGCEADHPDFAQPEYDPEDDPAVQQQLAAQLEAGLAFARCARDDGYAWVADPDPGTASLSLPVDLTEDEFRAVLTACLDGEAPGLAWSLPSAGLDFDWKAVLDESTGGAGGFSATQDAE
jgi:hypothetical protein